APLVSASVRNASSLSTSDTPSPVRIVFRPRRVGKPWHCWVSPAGETLTDRKPGRLARDDQAALSDILLCFSTGTDGQFSFFSIWQGVLGPLRQGTVREARSSSTRARRCQHLQGAQPSPAC